MYYAELHCISNFSFLRGASHPQELVERASQLSYQAIAITDECSLAGVVKAHTQQKALASTNRPIKLIVGSEFSLPDRSKIIALAKDRGSYEELSAFISYCRRKSSKGSYQFNIKDLDYHLNNSLLIYSPRPVEQSFENKHYKNEKHREKLSPAQQDALYSHLKKHPNCWVAVNRTLHPNDEANYKNAYQIASLINQPMVACGNVYMHCRSRKPLSDTLSAIRLGKTLDELGENVAINAENYLRSLNTLSKIYPDELLRESTKIAELCNFSLDELRYQYPSELVPKTYKPIDYLRQLVEDGASKRWPEGIKTSTRQQIEKELSLIEELNYEYYFLTVHDIVNFARSQNILCQGRGSAANSVVCYCLYITEVNPQRVSLLFERFISKERNEPPDIDVDFEHERREEVIQYIYKKYSRERAALAATVISYRSRSALQDVGKALGLNRHMIEKISRSLGWWSKPHELEEHLRRAGMDLTDYDNETSLPVSRIATDDGQVSMASLFIGLVKEIIGFPRHLSQHVGGFIISNGPVSRLVPVENASMPERTVIQWDKEDIEALGLLKIDVLALGMLSAIRKAIAFANSYPGIGRKIAIENIPEEDKSTYNMLCKGDSIGVFQVESRAQISMLPRLKPRTFYDLVIQVAIVRPGPIQGDMVHPFLRRREGSEAVSYENEAVRNVLSRTLGVPIFQEQVIKLAMIAAGFSGGEADQLRRAMASWGKNGNLLQFEEKLISGMLQRGYSQAFAKRLFEQMKGFGSYGFPESHAASFALLVYVSSWLKCHYPAAFYAALINSQPMGFYSPSQLIQDAKRHKVLIKPIDVNHSAWNCTLEWSQADQNNPSLRLGMRLVKGLSEKTANTIEASRQSGALRDLEDLQRRCKLNTHERQFLIRAGATHSLSGNRHQSHWQNMAISSQIGEHGESYAAAKNFPDNHHLNDQVMLDTPDEADDIRADYSYTGLTLRRHPMLVLREKGVFTTCKRSIDLTQISHQRFVQVAGIVTGRQRPGTASGVIFLTLEDETGNINVVIWRDRQQQFREALLKSRLLLVKGVLERKNEVVHVIAGKLVDLSHHLEGYLLPSRDFH